MLAVIMLSTLSVLRTVSGYLLTGVPIITNDAFIMSDELTVTS